MPRDDLLYVHDIREACEDLIQFVEGRTRDELVSAKLLAAAILQKFIVIGEAASRLSVDLKNLHPSVEWHSMIAMRNVAVHGYFAINWNILWTTATSDVPALLAELRAAFADEL
jgi:uncharacterized protein with HEPN domain